MSGGNDFWLTNLKKNINAIIVFIIIGIIRMKAQDGEKYNRITSIFSFKVINKTQLHLVAQK